MTAPLKLRLPPKDYQADGIRFAVEKRYSLNGDQMGLGKTCQALGAVAAVQAQKILVVCPSFLVFNWRDEILKFLGPEAAERFHVVSYNSLHKFSAIDGFDFVIADEAHYVKNFDAKRTTKLHELVEKRRPPHFMALSGTPIKNSVPEIYSLLKLCWYGGRYPEFDVWSKSMYGFLHKFTHKKTEYFGSKQITKYEGLRNPEELKALIRAVYIRRKTEQVLTLPPKTFQEILAAETSEFDEEIKAAWEGYGGGKDQKLFTSAKAVSALAKVKHTVGFAEDLLEQGERVVIFSDHVQAATEIAAALGGVVITGSVDAEARAQAVRAFEDGAIKVLVGTIGAISVGINLTSCSRMIFNDLPWVPADLAQAEGRIYRIGQVNPCFYYYILASRQDQVIYRTLVAKKKLIEAVGV
jgi:SNF2 family DNA or RNA helicase